jgi:dTDP-4-amino-4,6-dideoxygalactose transaminase
VFNLARRERDGWYRELLDGESRCSVPFAGHEGTSSHHLFTVILQEGVDRSRVMEDMKKQGIQTSIHYPPIHQFSFYRKLLPSSVDLRVTEDFGSRVVTLPLYPDMTFEQVRSVCEALRTALG